MKYKYNLFQSSKHWKSIAPHFTVFWTPPSFETLSLDCQSWTALICAFGATSTLFRAHNRPLHRNLHPNPKSSTMKPRCRQSRVNKSSKILARKSYDETVRGSLHRIHSTVTSHNAEAKRSAAVKLNPGTIYTATTSWLWSSNCRREKGTPHRVSATPTHHWDGRESFACTPVSGRRKVLRT